MSRRPAKPVLYFSFRSPYSWLALRDLEERLPDAPSTVEYRPWWEPDERMRKELQDRGAPFPYIPMSKAKHLYILQDVKRLATERGVRVAWPVDTDPWWEVPHLGWIAARRLGRDRELLAALWAARWERGENICDPEVLRRAAEEAGADPEPVVGAAHDPEIRAEALESLVQVYEDDAFGIPYFKVGRHRYWGIDRLDGFIRELSLAEVPTLEESSGKEAEAYDHDTAGGCG